MELLPTILLVVLFVVLEGFFSGTELAFISISRPKLWNLVEKGNRAARMIESHLKLPARLYGTTSLGTNIMVVSGTAVVTAYFAQTRPEDADLWALLIMTPVTLLFGEIFPKSFLRRWTDVYSYYAVYPLTLSQTLFTPVLWVTSGITRMIFSMVGMDEKYDVNTITHEELRHQFRLSEKEFDLHPDEKRTIHRIFQIKNTTAEQCMVPLIKVSAVRENETIQSVRSRLHQSGYSLLPVYKDKVYNITGILNAFDVLRYGSEAQFAHELARPAYYVYMSKKINDLLTEMQQAGVQMAVVVNEYSAAIGIVTREDLAEEIFGEIEDEYDKRAPNVVRLAQDRWAVDAGVEVDLLNEQYGWNLPKGDYETVAGLILARLDHIPKAGETVTIDSLRLIVREATEKGIQKIEVVRMNKAQKKT